MGTNSLSQSCHAELRPILDTVLDAVVVINLDGDVVAWNSVAEHIFGWPSQVTIGQSLAGLLVPSEHREAHNAGIKRLLAGGTPRVLNRLIEISALTARGDQIPVELSITTTQTSSGPLFIGFLRDITAKKDADKALQRQASEAQLMFDVARLAAEADSFESALEKVLASICQVSGWAVGHAFVVSDATTPHLISTSIWYEEAPGAADAMRCATAGIEFAPGVGLPGTILASGEPAWVADSDNDGNFPRASAGFRGAFGFPLKAGDRIIAILEFFSRTPSAPDASRLLTVRILGEQIGRLFERRRREDRERVLLHELDHRVKNLLMVVQAIATQTFRKSASAEEGLVSFSGRLKALGEAQDLLLGCEWTNVNLRDLIENGIRGSGNDVGSFEIKGPETNISPDHAVPTSLAVHELCTNSVKYGALSVPEGRICISWEVDANQREVRFQWREFGGPPVVAPSRKGFGSTLLGSHFASALGGNVQIEYARDGLVFLVRWPLTEVRRET
ncbi:HWE histidine kinase domain-containing protein [Parablastomonas sp. CN1-191]|uniref:sensor histidine kinase n=1 Tax=Parablastomonas sp. CN1-191 TaxID=3400908 RepID=UPI003BF8AB42